MGEIAEFTGVGDFVFHRGKKSKGVGKRVFHKGVDMWENGGISGNLGRGVVVGRGMYSV